MEVETLDVVKSMVREAVANPSFLPFDEAELTSSVRVFYKHSGENRQNWSEQQVALLLNVTRAKQAQACNSALCLRISDIFT